MMKDMINVALPKGRLGEKVYSLFESAGYACPAVLDPGRRLLFENEDAGVRYFWVKPSDVPIYVERGVADAGVAGKDVLLESRPDVYELCDLMLGRCRMAVAAKEGFCTIFTASGDSRRKINWVLTDYSVCNYSRNHMPLVKQALRSIDLNIADSTQAMIAYNTVFKVRNSVTIHNLMDTASIERKLAEDPDGKAIQDSSSPNLISVVRFHPQKAVDRLLYASQEAAKAGYAHTLYLVGGGEEEGKLRKIVSDLKMDNVVFLGYMANPYGAMRKADLFVLPSLYEGFATVISESLIVGTPVLSTDVSGAREQITKPDEGWVVENSQEGLNNGLIEALSNPDRLKEMKKALAGYTYPNDDVLQQFMDVL